MQKARRHTIAFKAPTACKRMVSGSISPPYSGYFSPFPHGTGSLSVSQEYLALPDGAGRFKQDFHVCRATQDTARGANINFLYGTITLYGPFPDGSIHCCAIDLIMQSYNPKTAVTNLVWANPRSLATTWESLLFSLPPGT